MSDYLNRALTAGFTLERLVEPQPSVAVAAIDKPWFEKHTATPTMIVFSFIK